MYEPIAGYDKVTYAAAMCVLGSWALLLIIGAQLSWGNMSTYFASYFHYLGAEVTMAQFYKVQPIIVVTATLIFPLGIHAATRYNAKL